MNILFVITKSNWGGAQRYVYTLAHRFKRAGARVAVVAGGTGVPGAKPGALSTRLESAGIPFIPLRAFTRDIFILRDLRAFLELYSLIRKERPDVLHLNSSKAGGLGALVGRLAGVRRIVFTSHGLAYDEDRSFLPRALIFLATWVTFLLSDVVIMISKDTFERGRGLPFCAAKMRLVYNGVEPVNTISRAEANAALSATCQTVAPEGVLRIGTVAELTRNKGLSYLISAARRMKESGVHFNISIVGEGDGRAALAAQIEAEGVAEVVSLCGFVDEASRYLSAFDIFVLPSVKEGLPYVLLEAGSAGCAVVASRIPGVTDIVEENRSGVLVEARDDEELAEALRDLLSDSKRRALLGSALRERVRSLFTIERMTEATLRSYRD